MTVTIKLHDDSIQQLSMPTDNWPTDSWHTSLSSKKDQKSFTVWRALFEWHDTSTPTCVQPVVGGNDPRYAFFGLGIYCFRKIEGRLLHFGSECPSYVAVTPTAFKNWCCVSPPLFTVLYTLHRLRGKLFGIKAV